MVRVLQPNEWYKLNALGLGSVLPLPTQGMVFIEEQDGDIVGVFAMEQVMHIGPVWVSERSRGDGTFLRLLNTARSMFPKLLRGGIVCAKNAKVARLARRLGLQEITMPVFKWEK